eukprot:2335719-Prymnesium_polylepis.1
MERRARSARDKFYPLGVGTLGGGTVGGVRPSGDCLGARVSAQESSGALGPCVWTEELRFCPWCCECACSQRRVRVSDTFLD